MEKLNFKDELTFDEFPPVTTEQWEEVIESDLKGKNYKDILQWESGEGVDVLPFYRKEDLERIENPDLIHTSASWNVIEPIAETELKKANQLALHALQNGASGLTFDFPSKAVTSKEDLELLLNDIKIEFITVKFGPALSDIKLVEWLASICEDRGILGKDLDIFFSFDPFSSAIRTGELLDLNHIQKILTGAGDRFHYAVADSAIYANSGATIVQQIAFSLAAGNELLGMIGSKAGNVYFNFASGPNYFPEIAKFRAFQLMWTQVLDEYGIKERVASLHAESAHWNKSKTDAHNNMLRATTETMSAALGGCDVITVHPYNSNFEDPSGFSSRIARNVQLILQEEAYLDKVADPGAGSYYIEILTNKIAKESWKLFQQIEAKGGFHECLKKGFIQDEIQRSRKEKIAAYKEKKEILVGVNKYQPSEIQNSKLKTQNFDAFEFPDASYININKVPPLNIEAELQKGDA